MKEKMGTWSMLTNFFQFFNALFSRKSLHFSSNNEKMILAFKKTVYFVPKFKKNLAVLNFLTQ